MVTPLTWPAFDDEVHAVAARTQETSGSGEPDTNRTSLSTWGNTNGKVDAQTSARYTLPLTKDR